MRRHPDRTHCDNRFRSRVSPKTNATINITYVGTGTAPTLTLASTPAAIVAGTTAGASAFSRHLYPCLRRQNRRQASLWVTAGDIQNALNATAAFGAGSFTAAAGTGGAINITFTGTGTAPTLTLTRPRLLSPGPTASVAVLSPGSYLQAAAKVREASPWRLPWRQRHASALAAGRFRSRLAPPPRTPMRPSPPPSPRPEPLRLSALPKLRRPRPPRRIPFPLVPTLTKGTGANAANTGSVSLTVSATNLENALVATTAFGAGSFTATANTNGTIKITYTGHTTDSHSQRYANCGDPNSRLGWRLLPRRVSSSGGGGETTASISLAVTATAIQEKAHNRRRLRDRRFTAAAGTGGAITITFAGTGTACGSQP